MTTLVTGEPRVLPAVIDVAAARIVQESLTNVVRHSTAEHAEVTVTYGSDALEVTVENDGRPLQCRAVVRRQRNHRHAERARALGGELAVRRHPVAGSAFRRPFR